MDHMELVWGTWREEAEARAERRWRWGLGQSRKLHHALGVCRIVEPITETCTTILSSSPVQQRTLPLQCPPLAHRYLHRLAIGEWARRVLTQVP